MVPRPWFMARLPWCWADRYGSIRRAAMGQGVGARRRAGTKTSPIGTGATIATSGSSSTARGNVNRMPTSSGGHHGGNRQIPGADDTAVARTNRKTRAPVSSLEQYGKPVRPALD